MKKETKKAIPLFISILLVVVSIGIVSITDYILFTKHYIGIVVLALSVLLFYNKSIVYYYFFALTLVAGTLHLIDFFYISFGIGIGFLEINPLFLALLISFIVLNKEEVSELFPKKNSDLDKKKRNSEKKIKHFENKFLNKTEFELRGIIDENSPYVEEARIAGKRVLDKK